jgi:hypothetical protein
MPSMTPRRTVRTTVGSTSRFTPREGKHPSPGMGASPTAYGGLAGTWSRADLSHTVSEAHTNGVDNGRWASGEPTRQETIRWASGPPGGRPVPDFPGGLQPIASVGGGGMPDATVGNNPAHKRREGSTTFVPGHGTSTTTKAGEYNNPASPTGRGGRKFRPAVPPAYSPPKVFERLPPASTYFGSTTGLVAPRMAPPGARWPPPPLPPDEGVSAQTERAAREAQVMPWPSVVATHLRLSPPPDAYAEALIRPRIPIGPQVMRRLRQKLVQKYGDWRGCFKVGDKAPGMVSREQIVSFLHHRSVQLTPDEHEVLFDSFPGGGSARKIPFKTFVDAVEGGTTEQMDKADKDFEIGKARVATLLEQVNECPPNPETDPSPNPSPKVDPHTLTWFEQANKWPFVQKLVEHMAEKNDGAPHASPLDPSPP